MRVESSNLTRKHLLALPGRWASPFDCLPISDAAEEGGGA